MSRARSEVGMSVVEVLVAATVLVVGIGATFQTLDGSRRLGLDAQRQEQAITVAQREVERLQALPYAKLGVTSLPTTSSDPMSPNAFVRSITGGMALLIRTNYRDPSDTSTPAGVSPSGEPVVVTTTGLPAGPERFASGTTGGVVHRYVTWRDERCPDSRCDGTQDSKRITVAVRLDRPDGRGPAKPVWISSVVTDPLAIPPGEVPPPTPTPTPGPTVSAQPFFLTDTPCGLVTRRTPSAHTTRNTAGTASACPTTATTPPAAQPDLMTPTIPSEPDTVALFDYSSDRTRSPQQGLALARPAADCPATYTGTTQAARATAHRWATPAFASAFKSPATASQAALSFWTQTADAAPGAVTLCITLRRQSDDSAIVNGARYVQAEWPTEPTQLSVTFPLPANVSIPAGDRLLLSLSLTSASQRDVVLLYDHPVRQSFVSIPTVTPQ